MRIIFMGSADLSCLTLDALIDDSCNEVQAVITQPDKPKGRALHSASCPVKMLALERGLEVITPDNVNSDESVKKLSALNAELIVVVAYGQILRKRILELPSKGCINMHASLLPKYRGAAPVQWAVANGETVTGVTTMFMSETMDAGDIIMQKEVAVDAHDTAGSLHDKLALEGAAIIVKTIEALRNNQVTRIRQNDSEVTFAPKLTKKDGKIDWTIPAEEIYNRVRGFNPWPMCWCNTLREENGSLQILRVLDVRVEDVQGDPGKVLNIEGEGPLIGTGRKSVRLLTVQPEGKRIMSGNSYVCGHNMKIGQVIE